MCLTFALKGPRISTFRRRNPLELETPNLDWVFDGPDGVPSERTRKPGADRAPGRRFSFEANQQKHSSDLRPPLSGRSIPLHFFKAHVRQQKLQPPDIGPWRRPSGTTHIALSLTGSGSSCSSISTSIIALVALESFHTPRKKGQCPPLSPLSLKKIRYFPSGLLAVFHLSLIHI